MWKKVMSVVVVNALILLLTGSSASASSKDEKEAKDAERVHAGITKLGTGLAARVEVKLRDKTKLKGYVDQVAEDHFVIIDDRTGAATSIAYPQVKQIKGNNLSTGAKIAIGIVAFVAFCVLFAWAVPERR